MLKGNAKYSNRLLESENFGGCLMEEAKVSSKGQIVIPKYLRDAVGLQPGKTALIIKDGSKLVLMPKSDDPLKGLADVGEEIAMKNIRREIKPE